MTSKFQQFQSQRLAAFIARVVQLDLAAGVPIAIGTIPTEASDDREVEPARREPA